MSDKTNNQIFSDVGNLELYTESVPFRLPLRVINFENERAYMLFIKNVERMVRCSLEYKVWRHYIIDILGVNTCAITNENMVEVTIEIHHHLPPLFMIVRTLVNKYIDEEIEFCTFDIATEVIKLHFANRIGYVALISSMHEKLHNGFLDLPLSYIQGDYQWFLDTYGQWIDDADMELINLKLSHDINTITWKRGIYPGSEEQSNE